MIATDLLIFGYTEPVRRFDLGEARPDPFDQLKRSPSQGRFRHEELMMVEGHKQ